MKSIESYNFISQQMQTLFPIMIDFAPEKCDTVSRPFHDKKKKEFYVTSKKV